MNKLNSSVLDRISENNNEYRAKLRSLNNQIEEKVTSLVGELVTLSNYVIDFSKTINASKEELSNPLTRLVENYVIKDLRGVETVNEQFVDKINDRLAESDIANDEDKENFINSLDNLLNNKYLEIVKIKRVNFTLGDGKNREVEEKFENFENYIKTYQNVNIEALTSTIDKYKALIYSLISDTLTDISNLYLNNFADGIKEALDTSIKFDNKVANESAFTPFTPEVNESSDIKLPSIPSISDVKEEVSPVFVPNFDNNIESNDIELPEIPSIHSIDNQIKHDDVKPMDVPNNEPVMANKPEKKQYDVEEILKIAKSPIVTMEDKKEEEKKDSFVSVEPISFKEEKESATLEFDEAELVDELIRRLSNRLAKINERSEKFESDKKQLEDDESFVNSLIDSSNKKQKELDEFELELNKKEEELELKQKELNKKINDVLPFANAVMNMQKES